MALTRPSARRLATAVGLVALGDQAALARHGKVRDLDVQGVHGVQGVQAGVRGNHLGPLPRLPLHLTLAGAQQHTGLGRTFPVQPCLAV